MCEITATGRRSAPSFLLGWLCVSISAFAAEESGPEVQEIPQQLEQRLEPFLVRHCTECHAGEEPEAELNLATLVSRPDFLADRVQWEEIAKVLKERVMPPEADARPTEAEYADALEVVTAALATVDCSQLPRDPGRVQIHRLNRAEYNNTIRDLVGVDFQPADDFPQDEVGEGFDNMAAVLSLSPVLFEKYLDAAEEIVHRALENRELREQLIFRRPNTADDNAAAAREVLARFAMRAFRRPVGDEELASLMKLVDAAARAGLDFDAQVATGMQAILVSPHFLFRIEVDDFGESEEIRPLNDYELASRLSYFLWSSMPDETLFELAARGTLQDDDVLAEQVKRMLNDKKAAALGENFAGQWLQLRRLANAAPDRNTLPHYDDALRRAAETETRLFFASIVNEDRSVLDLLDADYSFVNGRLATHYGIPGVVGDAFVRVTLPPERGGVLTHASILTITSNPTRTSPVKRGKWILEVLLDDSPPPPPPNAGELAEGEGVELLGSLRERLEQHRADATCASCHQRMDPLGFALENFDPVGRWRDQDGKHAIDASGTLPDGSRFDGPGELRAVLRDTRQDAFCRSLVRNMLAYALGRGVRSSDRCTIDEILRHLTDSSYRFSALAVAIAQSEPFRYRSRSEDKPR